MTPAVILLLTVIATSDPPPCTDMPKTCEQGQKMMAEKFGGDRRASERWARKCGVSRLMILQGRLFCGL